MPIPDPEGSRWDLALSGEREGRRVIFIPPVVELKSLIAELTLCLGAGVTRDWLPRIRRAVRQIAAEVLQQARYGATFSRSTPS